MSLSKELSDAKILAKKISDAQSEIRAKTLSLKLGQQEKASSINTFLKPVSDPLSKLVQIKEKKADRLENLRQSLAVKREPTSSLRLLPGLLKKFDSPSGKVEYGSPMSSDYRSPLSSWNFDSPATSQAQTPESTVPSTSAQSPIEVNKKLFERRYDRTVFPIPGVSPVRVKLKPSRLSLSMPNSPKPSKEFLQRMKDLERRRGSLAQDSMDENSLVNWDVELPTAIQQPIEEHDTTLIDSKEEELPRFVQKSIEHGRPSDEHSIIDLSEAVPSTSNETRDSITQPSVIIPDDKSSLIDRFFKLYNERSMYIDPVTGIKNRGGKYYLGKKEITFTKTPVEHFRIDGKDYKATRGLMELLFLKQPDQDQISQLDERNFRKIIDVTQLEGITTKVQRYAGKGLMLETNREKEYVYFDDPNELVERLLLLKRSQASGNTFSHINEIQSIEEELLEGGYIYWIIT